jgi:hypothetical protein
VAAVRDVFSRRTSDRRDTDLILAAFEYVVFAWPAQTEPDNPHPAPTGGR